MTIQKLPIVDFEPYTFRLCLKDVGGLPSRQVEEFLKAWLVRRSVQALCDVRCSHKYLNVRDDPSTHEIVVSIQWVCADCIDILFRELGDNFPAIERIVIGFPAPGDWHGGTELCMTIAGRLVTFEDSHVETVSSFNIFSKPINIGQMLQFRRETGYRTSAERVGGLQANFQDNPFVAILPAEERERFEAKFLSYRDAVAYCSWAMVRLPSEAEYLAAALVDDEVHDINARGAPIGF